MALDFSLSDEQQAARRTAEQLLKRFEPRRAEFKEMIFHKQEYPEEIWQALAEAGFLGALIPEEYGGSDAGLLNLALGIDAMGAYGGGGPLLVVTSMDVACIVKAGSDDLKQRILPGVADGSLKLGFAVTEASAGSNAFRLATYAEPSDDGSVYRITGEKTFITGADVADYLLVILRTTKRQACIDQGLPKAYGLSLFMVDPKTKGISLTPLKTRGIEGHKQFTVSFEDAEVPAENIIGEPNAGAVVMFLSMNPERILAAAIGCGLAEHMIKRSAEYANERKLFGGKPIGAYQAISHPLAELKIELESTRHLMQHAAWAFDQDEHPGEVGFWANAAKYKAAELAITAVDRAIQTHGGNGFDEDYDIIHYWEAARLLRTAPITKEMILNYVAEHNLDLPRGY